MLSAYEKVTNEAGQTFVLLPLEEYEQMLEDTWHRKIFDERRNDEVNLITLEELQARVGLK
jgi:PHD/YefM family antitoxin component YafN of YafNO toxin-antitoxin module